MILFIRCKKVRASTCGTYAFYLVPLGRKALLVREMGFTADGSTTWHQSSFFFRLKNVETNVAPRRGIVVLTAPPTYRALVDVPNIN